MFGVVGAVRAVFAFYIGSHPHGVLLGICQVVQGGAGSGDGFGEVGTLGFVGNVNIVFGGPGYLVPLVC